ncbi:MAG TPA: ChbG/HpnK family deacetylase [Gemmatales bacterium]|nr:ChbG/HpnK family deacetylase [Gemmatales bacterium]
MRQLLIVADDYGVGLPTSRGILDLAHAGVLSAALVQVNSPHASAALALWRQQGEPLELGWHPCLTLDRPVLAPQAVPSLVGSDGRFHRLRGLLWRWLGGRLRGSEIRAELAAQLVRFQSLVGHAPRVVAAHHHMQVFPPIGPILLDVLARIRPRPYVRRVLEPRRQLMGLAGGRPKRVLLNFMGQRFATVQRRRGFPGNTVLAGVTDPHCVAEPNFFLRCLAKTREQEVELMCHPGYEDPSLLGRDDDGGPMDRLRRGYELQALRHPSFREGIARLGFEIVPPTAWREGADVRPRRVA